MVDPPPPLEQYLQYSHIGANCLYLRVYRDIATMRS